jgi:hypothetical protein
MYCKEIVSEGVEWIKLAHDMNQWRTFINFYKLQRISLPHQSTSVLVLPSFNYFY